MKPTELLLSVIVPVYNREKTLSATVESVLACPDKRLELILVNDGSKDNSLALCRSFAEQDGRVRVIDKENGGVSSARNAGIEEAKGKYLFFCDGDDLVVTETLASALDLAETHSEDLLVFDFQYHFLDSDNMQKSGFVLPPEQVLSKADLVLLLLEPLLTREATDLAGVWHKFFLSDRLQTSGIRFEEKVAKGEDWRFILDFLDAAETAFYFPKLLYTYNLDGSQTISKYKRVPGQHLLGSAERKLTLSEKYHLTLPEKDIARLYQGIVDDVFYSVLSFSDPSEAKKMLLLPLVQNATSFFKWLKKKQYHAFEISRKYQIYVRFIEWRATLLIRLCARNMNL